MMAVRAKTPVARASHVGSRAGIVFGAVAGAAGISATGNPALGVEEGETLPTAEMKQELKAHNMRIYGTGDFIENVEGADTPNDPSDDAADLKIAVFAATPDGSHIWILKGDTPKSADTSNEFTVVEKARNLRIVDNEGTPQQIPYENGLRNPKADQYCELLTDPERVPEDYDYFIDNDIEHCSPFAQIINRATQDDSYIYAQALSQDELQNGKTTKTVLTIRTDDSINNNPGFAINKTFVGPAVTYTIGHGTNIQWTQHAQRLEKLQQ